MLRNLLNNISTMEPAVHSTARRATTQKMKTFENSFPMITISKSVGGKTFKLSFSQKDSA